MLRKMHDSYIFEEIEKLQEEMNAEENYLYGYWKALKAAKRLKKERDSWELSQTENFNY